MDSYQHHPFEKKYEALQLNKFIIIKKYGKREYMNQLNELIYEIKQYENTIIERYIN